MAKRARKNKSKPADLPRADTHPAPAAASPQATWIVPVQAAILLAASLWIYWPALNGGWLWDDDIYVTDNPLLHDLSGLWRIWFEPGALREYYPLDDTVWWIEWHLWGMATPGYHITNLTLHLLGSLLVWRLLARLGLRFAWLGGMIFALHPLQVESAAWIAELKNTLSLPIFLLAMLAWVEFEERRRRRDYLLALALYFVAMLGKQTMLAFPPVILLYAWWKRGRVNERDVWASVPFFALALVLGGVSSYFAQKAQPVVNIADVSASSETLTGIMLAGLVLPFVIWYVILPFGLMPVYPGLKFDSSSPVELLAWPIFGAVIFYSWIHRRTWGRHALLGLGFFLAMLAPVLVFVAGNYVTMTWSMDHLDYLPMIGVAGLTAAILAEAARHITPTLRLPAMVLLGLVLAGMAWQSRFYASLYATRDTLMRYALKMNPEDWTANYNLGLEMLNAGQTQAAIEQFEQALKTAPLYAQGHCYLGNAYERVGRKAEAMGEFQRAVDIQPTYADAHYNLGLMLKDAGQLEAAAEQYRDALQNKPDLYLAHYNLGNVLLGEGDTEEAIAEYHAALKLAPDYADAHDNLAGALLKSGQAPEAVDEFKLALKDGPDNSGIRYNLANALYLSGRPDEAIAEFEQALKLDPNLAGAHYNLGYILMQKGRTAEAIEQFEATLKIHPDDAGARENLEKLKALPGSAPVK
jgi:tetratricopeptide (TPR) repeat protein